MNARIGRPTNNPKTEPVNVRLDKECKEILDIYCKQEETTKTEAIRRGIRKLKSDIKN